MDIETITTIMDDVLKGVLDLNEYPYSAKRRFGTGNKVATGSLRASIMVVPTSKKGMISFQIFANDYSNGFNQVEQQERKVFLLMQY